jgi:hypothetical protein
MKGNVYDPGENTRVSNDQRQNSYMNSNGRPSSKVNGKPVGNLSDYKATKIKVKQPIMPTNPLREEDEETVDKYMLQ